MAMVPVPQEEEEEEEQQQRQRCAWRRKSRFGRCIRNGPVCGDWTCVLSVNNILNPSNSNCKVLMPATTLCSERLRVPFRLDCGSVLWIYVRYRTVPPGEGP